MLKKLKINYLLMAFFMALSLLAGCGGGGGGSSLVPMGTEFTTAQGNVLCVDEGDMIACRGIPYAKPPIGDRRFAPPVALDDDDKYTDFDASTFGAVCPQKVTGVGVVGNEDCLTLNIFMPKYPSSNPDGYPVMFWIHGGAFIQGSSSVGGYDMPALVNQGVIVVTINYRLNALGFLPHPALEDPTGNFGLKDQAFALKWVQENITDFGGDPGNVTIFGESAGGHSVLSLLVAATQIPATLFHKAIVQSGSYSPTQMSLTTGYYVFGLPFATLPGPVPSTGPCGNGGVYDAGEIRTCLRGLTVQQIFDTQDAAPAWAWPVPVYQASTFLPKSINVALTDGDIANVPVMIGTNRHEGSLFGALFLGQFNGLGTQTDYRNAVLALLATDTRPYDKVKAADSYETFATNAGYGGGNIYRNAYSMVWTDSVFTCNNLNQWMQLVAAGRTVYAYWFSDQDAPINDSYYSALYPIRSFFSFGNWGFGAAHSFEIQYVFGHVKDHPDVTSAQRTLSDRMTAYWANFAKNGAPGGGWTDYSAGSPNSIRTLHFNGDTMTSVSAFANTHHCLYWANPETYWSVDP